ncbi:MAG: hypothetical protein JXB46_08875 [Candidatus Eisenbacteria bacterium]|nr:hypothetical protein [Candidatus Eisenbacteria bacterium]
MNDRTAVRKEPHTTSEQILSLLDDPRALEALYRENPAEFRRALDGASRAAPESVVLDVWRARLEGETAESGGWRPRVARAATIVVVFGALIRLPALWVNPEWYYSRFAPLLVVMALCTYFWTGRRERGGLSAGLFFALACSAYLWLLPNSTDTSDLVLMHAPIVFWTLLGLVFAGHGWRTAGARIEFLRYNGELLVLASLVALGGIVFSGVTIALLQLVSDSMGQWYMDNIAVFGFVAVPVGATLLYDTVFRARTRIAAVLARVFAPLFLIMSVAYLVIAFASRQNPFLDRSFLITFNGLLLIVLGITVISIAERDDAPKVRAGDAINFALVSVTLLIDVIALAAIVFRLASFGLSPNRIAVLGANLVIMAHLAWLLWTYIRTFRGRAGVADMRLAVAHYLPVYGIWAALVVFLLPPLFRFA